MAHNEADTIRHLYQLTQDSCEGYKNAAEAVDNPDYTRLFRERYSERKAILNRLAERLKMIDPQINLPEKGSTAGSIHQSFMKMRASLQNDEKAALSELDRGESHLVDEYQKALGRSLSPDTETDIRSILTDLQMDRDDIENRRKAA
jgi:uncharacterized protein (TIGR02284 family)